MSAQSTCAAHPAHGTTLQSTSAIVWPSFLTSLVVSAIAFFVADPGGVLECAATLGWATPIDSLLLACSVLFFSLWIFGAICGYATHYYSKPPTR